MALRAPADPATPASGLSAAEAARRLRRDGGNELPRARRRGLGRIVLGVLGEPTFLLLVVAAAIYLLVGGIGEGLLLSGFAALSTLLVVVQENRSENALDALRQLAAPTAAVLRDGRVQTIAAGAIVPGDLLLLSEGARIGADAILRHTDGVGIDESLLTGESVPVLKGVAADGADAAAEARAGVHAGALVVSGRGIAEVVATGTDTQAGRIGACLAAIEVEPTRLQRSFGRLVAVFAFFAVCASVAVVLLFGLLRGQWLQGALSGIALGMSALPEELPMILVVFMAIGARRLARLHVLVRRTAVIEMLGACSTLCVDKTGTLTENRMALCTLVRDGVRLDPGDAATALPEPFAASLQVAMRASPHTSGDPMDVAVHRLAAAVGMADDGSAAGASPLVEHGLSSKRPALIRVWGSADGGWQAAAKGAPETIAELCRLDAGARAALRGEVEALAGAGMRVLALAQSPLRHGEVPADPAAYALQWQGLAAFADPLRAGAAAAIAAARAAGVAVVMITGDHPATALAIAREVGIDATVAVTGDQIAACDDAQLPALVRRARVFARINPEQKLRLVRAFKEAGEVVAMTGDGVNDAPALRAAHIGLAMGRRSTDVAREAASIVLLEDDLRHLVAGIAMGRRIWDNLRKASLYIVAIHVPVIGLALLPLLLGLPPMLMPTHVVLIEMVIDPICAIAFENEPPEPDAMRQPPHPPGEMLLGLPQVAVGIGQGLLILAAAFAAYVAGLGLGIGADPARTLSFIAFTAGNLALVRVTGSRRATLASLFARGHGAYWAVATVAVAVLVACVAIPGVAGLFAFAAPPPLPLLAAAVAGVLAALAFDAVKWLPAMQRILGKPPPRPPVSTLEERP